MVTRAREQSKRYPSSTDSVPSLWDEQGRRVFFKEVFHGYGTRLWVLSQSEELSGPLRPFCRGGRGWAGSLSGRLQHDQHHPIGCGDRDCELAAAVKQSGGAV